MFNGSEHLEVEAEVLNVAVDDFGRRIDKELVLLCDRRRQPNQIEIQSTQKIVWPGGRTWLPPLPLQFFQDEVVNRCSDSLGGVYSGHLWSPDRQVRPMLPIALLDARVVSCWFFPNFVCEQSACEQHQCGNGDAQSEASEKQLDFLW